MTSFRRRARRFTMSILEGRNFAWCSSRSSMTSSPNFALRVVTIDDDVQHLKFISTVLSTDQVVVSTAADPHAGLELVRRERPHLVLVDLMMPGTTGIELLEKILEFDPNAEVVLLTGQYSTESAVEAIQKGAADYLTKPVNVEKLQQRVEAQLLEVRRGQRCLELENELLENSQFAAMVGHSPAMLEVFHSIRRVAPHFRSVLLTGETGVGKELAAQALHRMSPVVSGPFVTCNCSAVVETLAESELSLALQAKLLRVLQNQEIQRVGSPAVRRVDIRVIAATHRDLRSMVKDGRFREDLFYRLSMVHIKLPSLAQRKEDLPLFERHFIKRFSQQYGKPVGGITRRAQALLARYSWPGNVRELENVLGSACMTTEGETIDVSDLPEYIREQQLTEVRDEIRGEETFLTLEQVERAHAVRVLEYAGGNKVRAAELLGISRTKLYRILGESDSSATDATPPANPRQSPD